MDGNLTEQVGIVGSREGADLGHVASYVRGIAAKYPGTTIVSGGAPGVDKTAETTALAEGLRVVSFRPRKLGDDPILGQEWGAERWELGGARPMVYKVLNIFSVRTYTQALWLRNFLIADEIHRLVAFYGPRKSAGTSMTVDLVNAQEKPVYEHYPRET